MISSHDGELELLVYWTGTVSVVSHTGLGGTRASSDVKMTGSTGKLWLHFY